MVALPFELGFMGHFRNSKVTQDMHLVESTFLRDRYGAVLKDNRLYHAIKAILASMPQSSSNGSLPYF